MRPLPTPIAMETLLRLRRHEHDRAIRGSAFPCRPHLLEPFHLRPGLTFALRAPVAHLDPFEPALARPGVRPIAAEPQAAAAINPDPHHFNRIVAETDDAQGRKVPDCAGSDGGSLQKATPSFGPAAVAETGGPRLRQ
jgi:hypothetical protein